MKTRARRSPSSKEPHKRNCPVGAESASGCEDETNAVLWNDESTRKTKKSSWDAAVCFVRLCLHLLEQIAVCFSDALVAQIAEPCFVTFLAFERGTGRFVSSNANSNDELQKMGLVDRSREGVRLVLFPRERSETKNAHSNVSPIPAQTMVVRIIASLNSSWRVYIFFCLSILVSLSLSLSTYCDV